MEGLVDLLPLLFLAAYYLLRGKKRADQKRAVAPQEPLVSSDEPRAPTPFQNFLQQIEEAVAEAAGEPVAEPVPAPTVDRSPPTRSSLPAPPIKPVRPAPEFRAISGSFDSLRPSDHEAHGFGADNPLSEESFERRRAQAPRPERGPLPDPHGLRRQGAPPASGAARWRATLRDPQAARDAFVLQTIFGERGGRHVDPRGKV